MEMARVTGWMEVVSKEGSERTAGTVALRAGD